MGFEVVMDMDITTLVVVAVYFIGLIAIGAFASKKIKNSEDFLVAGTWDSGPSLFSWYPASAAA